MEKPFVIEARINCPIEEVWNRWINSKDIVNWHFATDSWHCPKAESDFIKGGAFNYRMEAKDGSMGFDFAGTFRDIKPIEYIEMVLGDGREVQIEFEEQDGTTVVTQTVEPEASNSREMQQQGWQAILDEFKRYTELHCS